MTPPVGSVTAVVLAPALDVSYQVGRLRVGQIHRPEQVTRCAGGKGLNMCRAAQTLGAASHAVVVLGGPVGRLVEGLLAESGVTASVVENDAETRICVSVADADRPVMTELYQRGTPLGPGVVAEVGRRLAERWGPGDWVVLNGGLPPGADVEEVVGLLVAARARGARLAVDCYGPVLGAVLRAGVDLVKVNAAEAAELVAADADPGLHGARSRSTRRGREEGDGKSAAVAEQVDPVPEAAPAPDAVTLAVALAARCQASVVVTDGAAGSVLVDEGRVVRVGPSEERGSHPVGSGDSYLGGMLAGLLAGFDLTAAVRLGAGAATANALQSGPGVLDPEQAHRLAANLVLEDVAGPG